MTTLYIVEIYSLLFSLIFRDTPKEERNFYIKMLEGKEQDDYCAIIIVRNGSDRPELESIVAKKIAHKHIAKLAVERARCCTNIIIKGDDSDAIYDIVDAMICRNNRKLLRASRYNQ